MLLRLLIAILVGAAAACAAEREEVPFLALTRFVQDHDLDVAINEPLVFHFSDVIDRASVTSASVRVVEVDERVGSEFALPIPGELLLDRKTLTFVPRLPLEADLADGSFRPGGEYRVELVGFPRVDGIRSVDGVPLAGSVARTFRVAREGDGALFAVGRGGSGVHLGGLRIGPLDPIELIVEGEAVDPRSLRAGEFEMLRRGGDVETDVVVLRPRLVENRLTGARLLLFPESGRPGSGGLRALEPGAYDLVRVRDELTGLSGQVLRLNAEANPVWSRRIPIMVVRSVESRRVTFESTAGRYFGEPFEFDATADWSNGGRGVTLRYPAAAGDGHDGAFVTPEALQGLDGQTDVHATELHVPKGMTLDVSSAHGFVVLRSQGTLEIDGALRRTLAAQLPSNMANELEVDSFKPVSEWNTLSDWMERSRRLNEPWTVLIAGGELRVRGEIRVDGPLMLIAGGWIRIYGRVDAAQVWKSHEGGDNGFNVSNAPLVLDAPTTNLLKRPLRAAVLSNPIRPPAGVERWLSAAPEIVASGGSATVRYLGLRDRLDGHGFSAEYSPVEDVGLLEGCQAVRLLLVVEMPAGTGEAWNPPTIEAVNLTWRRRASPVERE